MTSEAELLALAERCEKASEPDKELSAAVWLHLPEQEGHAWKHGGDKFKHAHQIAGCGFIPHYTASLDAAMTLIPGDEVWDVGKEFRTPIYVADLTCFYPGCEHEEDPKKVPFGRAATPALALCAAALRARAATMGGSDD